MCDLIAEQEKPTDFYATMPKKVRVGWLTYSIGVMDDDISQMVGAMGFVKSEEQVIKVARELPPQQLANTVLHEIVHAIHYQHGLTDESGEEEFTTMTTHGLCAFWQDNPEMMMWLEEAIHAD